MAVAQIVGGVPNANPRQGSPLNVVASGFKLQRLAQGNDALENPAGIFTRYGYLDDSTLQATDGQPTKTEPDQSTYVATRGNPGGPTTGYDYGRRFLIQGHEVFTPSGATFNRACFTRINLEGIHSDKLGNLIIVEDVGGSGVTDNGAATPVKEPNSFVFRFVPEHPSDLTAGKLQVLQVSCNGEPIVPPEATFGKQGPRDSDDWVGSGLFA